MKLTTLAVILLSASLTTHAQSNCAPGDAERAAILPLAIQNKLLTHKIDVDDLELDAPPDVGRDVVMLRKTLDVATQAFFRCETANDSNPLTLQSKLAAFLHTNQSKRDDNTSTPDGVYGANLAVHIETAKGFPNSVFIVLTFGIECGNDNLLFLYTKENGQWRQRLHWYSTQYSKPSDAYGNFFLYTLVPGPHNEPSIAVAHGTPWCTSRFSGFDVDLIQPASSSSPQKLTAHTEAAYSRGDTIPTLKANSTGMTLRLDASSRDLDKVFTYVGVFRYRTTSGTLERLPVADNARDFVDSWLDESWSVASQWSEPNSTLKPAHSRFSYATDASKDVPMIHYGSVRACTISPDRFQIKINLTHFVQSNGKPHEMRLDPIYAQIRQNPNSFTMLDITPKSDPACTGPDLMARPPTRRSALP